MQELEGLSFQLLEGLIMNQDYSLAIGVVIVAVVFLLVL
jgi:hypothetical protein